MAPTTLGAKPSASSSKNRSKERKPPATLFVKTKFSNNLPPPPFDCKFVACPFVDLKRFVAYKATSLETEWKREILVDNDLGVKVDLIDPQTYKACDPENMPEMHVTDRYLLEDEVANSADMKRRARHQRVVPWMRKTEYISSDMNRYGKNSHRQETSVGYNMKRHAKEGRDVDTPAADALRTVEQQLAAIERTFEECQISIVGQPHPNKKGVTAIEEMPFLPDVELWRNPFAQVTFDADPRPPTDSDLMANKKMCSALIRGMKDETGQFVAYFVPTDKALAQRAMEERADAAGTSKEKEADDDQEKEEFILTRNYTWDVLSKHQACNTIIVATLQKGYEEAYVVAMRDGFAYYNELETRVKLSRRRVNGVPQPIAKSRMYVTRTEETEDETAFRDGRLVALQLVQEEVVDEEMPPADEQADGSAVGSSDDEGDVRNGKKADVSDASDKTSSDED